LEALAASRKAVREEIGSAGTIRQGLVGKTDSKLGTGLGLEASMNR